MITYGPEFQHVAGDTRSRTVTVVDDNSDPVVDYFADATKIEFIVQEQMSGDDKATLSSENASEITLTDDKSGFVLHLAAAQIAALTRGRYRHVAKITWPAEVEDHPTYLLRNIFIVEAP